MTTLDIFHHTWVHVPGDHKYYTLKIHGIPWYLTTRAWDHGFSLFAVDTLVLHVLMTKTPSYMVEFIGQEEGDVSYRVTEAGSVLRCDGCGKQYVFGASEQEFLRLADTVVSALKDAALL
jgi:hypothetical protein